jgi:hypothetical protein
MDTDNSTSSERREGSGPAGKHEDAHENDARKYSLSPEEMLLLDEIHSEHSDEAEYFEKLQVIKELEQEDRQEVVKRALGKFNFFLHLTAYITGIAYLLLLGVLVRSTLPYVFIPIVIWTAGLCYHFFWAFLKKDHEPRRRKKPKKQPAPPRKLIEDDNEPPAAAPLESPDDKEHE